MITAAVLMIALAGPPSLPPRSAADQAHLTALADALGHAHALHRLCTGPADDLWRSRMGKLLDAERPDPGLRQRLTDAFNTGFAAGKDAFSECSLQSRTALSEAERRAAAEARTLATPLSQATKAPPP